MNNFLVKPGDGFWCKKGGHLPNCFGLKSILQLIRQPPVKTVCNLRFGNKHAILMINVTTPDDITAGQTSFQ